MYNFLTAASDSPAASNFSTQTAPRASATKVPATAPPYGDAQGGVRGETAPAGLDTFEGHGMRFGYYVAFGFMAAAGVAGAVLALAGPAPRGAKTPAVPHAALAAAPPATPAPPTDLGPKVRLVKGGWTGNAPTTRVDQPAAEPAAPADGAALAAAARPVASLAAAGLPPASPAGAGQLASSPAGAGQPAPSPAGAGQLAPSPAGIGQPILLQPAVTVDAAGAAPATPVALTTPREDPAGADRRTAIDINTASLEELNAIPGGGLIGRAIMRGRPYSSIADLQAKRILTRDTLERIRPYIAAQ
jgi:hypothetical protein